jgi:hypothetical protein
MALLLFCFCAFFGGGTAVGAKPVLSTEGPPIMAALDLKVEGRLPVRIVLKAAGSPRLPVKFVIRGEPEFGRVRVLKQLTAGSVEVEYLPPADRSIVSDSFLFTGSNSQGFASDSRAQIQIVDLGPRLAVPLALDFALTAVGQSARLPLEVRNSGDQPAEGRVTVSLPWELEDGADLYSLAPGEKKTLGLVFKPSRAGWQQGNIVFGGGASAVVQVRGEAQEWVGVAKDPVGFVWGNALEQTAELVLSNSGVRPLEVTVQASPPLEHAGRVLIEVGSSCSVPLSWHGSLVPGGWGTLLLSSQTGLRRVVVWSLDAVLSGLGPAVVLAGDADSAGVRRTFTNAGGRPGSWTFQCTAPFYLADGEKVPKKPKSASAPVAGPPPLARPPAKVLEAHAAIPGFVWDHNQGRYIPSSGAGKPASAPVEAPKETLPVLPKGARVTSLTRTLQPGESFELFVGIEGNGGNGRGVLSVTGPGQRHQEPLLLSGEASAGRSKAKPVASVPAVVKAPAALPLGTAVSGSPLPPPSASIVQKAASALGLSALPSLFSKKTIPSQAPPPPPPPVLADAFLPGLFLPGFRVKDVTSTTATIVFPAEQGVTPEHLEVCYRELHPVEGGGTTVEWLPFEASDRQGKRVGQNIEILLRGLPPNWSSFIELRGPLSANGTRESLYQHEIMTLPAAGELLPHKPWLWLVVVTALGGMYFWRRGSK